eukprot:jgi/Undpi1/12987/HiC_scaffold_7.g02651.m1
MLACLRYTDEKSTLMAVAGFEISIFTISGRQNHLSKMTSAGFEANNSLLCRVVDCSCFLTAPVCVLVLVPVAHFSAMTKIQDVLRRVRVKVSENTIPNVKAEVWKESAEGLHEVREDDDGNGDSLPLTRNLDQQQRQQQEQQEQQEMLDLRGGLLTIVLAFSASLDSGWGLPGWMPAATGACAAAEACSGAGAGVAAAAAGCLPGRVATVLGTMNIPNPLDEGAARQALEYFSAAGFDEIDTAIMYQGGKTETTLGDVGTGKFRVATKANPWYKDGKSFDDPVGGLNADSVKEQLRASLASLRCSSIDLFYLHAPDHDTPIEETLKAVHELRSEGLFLEWGLSNYAAWQAVDIWHICKANGWQTPSVYQGMYNAVTREVEAELLPALKKLGMRFYAYNPLAGGILTGKHKFDSNPQGGRFSSDTVWGGRYRNRFWHKPTFDALEDLKKLCEKHDTTLVSASLRWLYHHSVLSGADGDAVIAGGSSLEQIKANVDACTDDTPLPEELVGAFELAWEASKSRCPRYFR